MEKKTPDFHIPVLGSDVSKHLVTNRKGIYVDATVGGGGHAEIVLDSLQAEGRLIGIDRDPEALDVARERLSRFGHRAHLHQSPFWHLQDVLATLDIDTIDGILFDLGLSSHQIDTPERGFSFQQDGPLDMRMGPDVAHTAQHVVNTYAQAALTHIFKVYGEERNAGRITRAICIAREEEPITRTRALAELVARQVGAQHSQKTLARIFQAIRIEINGELAHLETAFQTAIEMLGPGGRIAVLSYHSLEHRIAKGVFQMASKTCIGPPRLPICPCNRLPMARSIVQSIRPGRAEIEANPRARSAALRVAERLKNQEPIWVCRHGV